MNAAASSDQLLAFIKFLRGRDIPISPADTLDAVHVASLIGYEDRASLRDGLGAVLAKSQREARLYQAAFDAFFAPPKPSDNSAPDAADQADPSATDDIRPGESGQGSAPSGGGGGGSPLEQLAEEDPAIAALLEQPLVKALNSGDEAALAVAIEAAATEARVDKIRMFTQRGQYIRKMLDAMGEQSLRDAAIDQESRNPRAFDELQGLREQLRSRARDRVERAFMVHAAGDTEEFLDKALSEVKLGNINPHQMARMRKLIDRMARKLASRHGRRRRKTRRGQLNIPATLRGAVATDGIPFEPRFRKVERRRPQVMAICDVSGSVASYAKFLLMFLYAVQDVLPRTRTFAFSSELGEVTDWFKTLPVETAVNHVNHRYGGATDYARAFNDFCDLALNDINGSTTVVILGDARNNDSDPRLDLLAQIKARCKRLIWLNPESRGAWGSGDSAMLKVIRHCHIATECNNLKQLERIVDKLLADSRGT